MRKFVHNGYICDICDDDKPIIGKLFKCTHKDCVEESFDLCSKHYGERLNFHPKEHYDSFTCFLAKDKQTKTDHDHSGFICDVCDDDKPIRGVRYNCLDCVESYDLCEKCYHKKETLHDKTHKFRAFIGCEKEFTHKPHYSCFLTTDKQIYKPGDDVYVRGIVLNTYDHRPCGERFKTKEIQILGKIKSPDGTDALAASKLEKPKNGVVSFKWNLPKDIVGGEYTVELESVNYYDPKFHQVPFFPAVSRKFDIMVYKPPRFKKELVFVKKAYGAGEKCRALLTVERAEGGMLKNATIECSARMDSEEIFRQSFTLDNVVEMDISFDLPKVIKEGQGSLNCAITEGVTENISKTIPVVLKRLDCAVFPEGGDLVAGVKNGCYVKAVTSTGDPADFEGTLVEVESQEEIVKIASVHEGRGYFEFTPKSGKKYHVVVSKPEGVVYPVELPEIKNDGISLMLKNKRSHKFGEDIDVSIATPVAKKGLVCQVVLWRKDEILDAYSFQELAAGVEKTVSFKSPKITRDGVLGVTVKLSGVPIAERILFVRPADELVYDISTQRKVYSPGEKVVLNILPKSRKTNSAVPSFYSVTVVDDSVYKMKDKRERTPSLLSGHYLENEVQDLFDSYAYISPKADNTDCKLAPDDVCDLLMGIEGWRRFVHEFTSDSNGDFGKVLEKYGQENRFKLLQVLNFEDVSRRDEFVDKKEQLVQLKKNIENQADALNEEKERKHKLYPQWYSKPKKREYLMSVRRKLGRKGREEKKSAPKKKDRNEKNIVFDKPQETKSERSKFYGKKKKKKLSREGYLRRKIRRMQEQYNTLHAQMYDVNIAYFRKYEHTKRTYSKDDARDDFTETLLYVSSFSSSDRNIISFDLNDSITSFRVFVEGWSVDGLIGYSNSFVFKSEKPFFIESKVPNEVSFKDTINLGVMAANNLDKTLKVEMSITVSNPKILKLKKTKWSGTMKPFERSTKRFLLNIQSSFVGNDKHSITVSATASYAGSWRKLKDGVTREIAIEPYGFPQYVSFSGSLEKNKSKKFKFSVPNDLVSFSLSTYSFLSPTFLGSLSESVKGNIREPCGCFEQVSSTMYPMILTKRFFVESGAKMGSKLLSNLNKFMKSGYKKLMGYENRGGGFDWYGSPPSNESLTAMGLQEFVMMKPVFEVSSKMIARTRKWLLSRKTATGFKRNPGRYGYGFAPKNCTNAYIVWALSRANSKLTDVESILVDLEKKLGLKNDVYVAALVALSYWNLGSQKKCDEIIEKFLKDGQDGNGGISKPVEATITDSWNINKTLETTALVCLAFFKRGSENNPYFMNGKKGIDFILSQGSYGRYGSTQATALALQAIVRYCQLSSVEGTGTFSLKVNNVELDKKIIPKTANKAIVLNDFRRNVKLKGAENEIEMRCDRSIPFSTQIAMKVDTPKFDKLSLPFMFDTRIINNSMKEGDTTEIEVTLKNKLRDKEMPMMVAVISVPGGLTPRIEKLKELQKRDDAPFAYYELFGARDTVFYFRGMQPSEEIKFKFDVSAAFAGNFIGDASKAYLYYSNEMKYFVKGLEVKISAK